MKRITALAKRKGFTLVECVIAIAVFAVLTSMVLMVVGNAIDLQKKSSDAEGDLNNLVSNVVQDDSKAVYGKNSDTLEMHFGTSSDVNFRMTYSTIDAYKNYIKCPNCHQLFNNIEYMTYLYDSNAYKIADENLKKSYKICYWFNKNTTSGDELAPTDAQNNLICPECGLSSPIALSSIEFRCDSCWEQKKLSEYFYDSESGKNVFYFELNPATGNYKCNKCGSENVGQVEPGTTNYVADALSSETAFMVSGLKADALRYGRVEILDEKDDVKDLIKMEGADDGEAKADISFSYTPNPSKAKPGVYTMTIKASGYSAGADGKITITLPGSYKPTIIDDPANPNDGSGYYVKAYVSDELVDYTRSNSLPRPCIKIEQVKSTNCNLITVKFTLENYMNKHTFEEDYVEDCRESKADADQLALARYWFQADKGNTLIQYPRTDGSINKLSIVDLEAFKEQAEEEGEGGGKS